MNRYRLDATVQRFGTTVIGGSPLKLFRLTEGGRALLDRIADGQPVADSVLVDSLREAGAIHPQPGTPGPYGEHDVTIVTPAYGTCTPIPGAILVDDASPQPIPGATLRLAVNGGAGVARNAGLELVTTPLVAFVDTDVDLPPGWLDDLLPHFADPRLGLVAPRVVSATGEGSIAAYERTDSPLDLGSQPARVRAGSRVSYVPAAAIVCRVDAVREVGGFDPTLRFGEDVDLVWRLDAAGWRCRYEPASVVSHAARATWGGWVRQRIGYGSSAAPLARRHPGALAPLRMSGWSIATWLLAATGRPLLGGAVGAGSAAALVRKLADIPPRAAFALAGRGNLHAGEQIAAAVRRAWWPLMLLAAVRSRSARRILLASALAAGRPLRLADDLAYSLGLWRGIVSERSPAALIPEISSWPGNRATPPANVR